MSFQASTQFPFMAGSTTYIIDVRTADGYINVTTLCKRAQQSTGKKVSITEYLKSRTQLHVPLSYHKLVYDDALEFKKSPYDAQSIIKLVSQRTNLPTGLRPDGCGAREWRPDIGPAVLDSKALRQSKKCPFWLHPLAARHLLMWMSKAHDDVRIAFDRLDVPEGLRYVGWAPPPKQAPTVTIREDGYLNMAELCLSCGKDYSTMFLDRHNVAIVTAAQEALKLPSGIYPALGEVQLAAPAAAMPIIGGYGEPEVCHRPFWVHPEVATALAQWVSPEARAAVASVYQSKRAKADKAVKFWEAFNADDGTICSGDLKVAIMDVIEQHTMGLVATKESRGVGRMATDKPGPITSFTGCYHHDGPVLYFGLIRGHRFHHLEKASGGAYLPHDYKLAAFGKTSDLSARTHGIERYDGIDFLDVIPCACMDKAERTIKDHLKKVGRLMRGIGCKGGDDTELFHVNTQEEWNGIIQKAQGIARGCDAKTIWAQQIEELRLRLAIEQEKTKQAVVCAGQKRSFEECSR